MADPSDRPTDAAAPGDPGAPAAGSAPRAAGSTFPPAADAERPPAPDAADLGRRRFFRQFAGDLANTAATMMGAAQALQRTSAELAGAILDPARAAREETEIGRRDAAGLVEEAAGPVFRTSFRFDGDAIRFVDQRALPRAVTEHVARSAAEVSWAVRNGIVIGGPAIGQAAGLGLALTAAKVRGSRPYARRATLRGAANALINSAPTLGSVRDAVRRVTAAYEAIGELDEDGDAIAAAMLVAAERVVADATADHGRLIETGLTVIESLPRTTDGPLRLLVHGPAGTLAGGQAGTALAIVIAAHHAEREVRVVVPEGRPGLAGARVSCWELAAAGVPYVLIADAAAPSTIAAGEVDAILVTADRVAANGDVVAALGTYGIAVAAIRQGVPLLACAPASAIDPAIASGAEVVIGVRPAGELDHIGDLAIAPRGSDAKVTLHDITPGELVTSFVTADALRIPPFTAAEGSPPVATPPRPDAPTAAADVPA
ncbi:MAG TPA: hypothetical protein VFO78_11470 [Candidatus Limnocylindrales bacterium]|nr:hypothetical protein [Candidatus Limnocylindrales bacterium]